jgi:hypothetical protein
MIVWLLIVIIFLLVAALVVAILLGPFTNVRRRGRHLGGGPPSTTGNGAWQAASAPPRWLKDIVVPLVTPIVVVLLGVGFGLISENQKARDHDSQKKAELLREVVASKDRPATASLTAIGTKLILSLNRRARILELISDKSTSEYKRRELADQERFEDRAAYFFFGMFHASLINFQTRSMGYQLYPRLWMREAFRRLGDRVDELVLGAEESSPEVSGIEESALYANFGAAAARYKNYSEIARAPTNVLFDFNLMLDKSKKSDLEEALSRGYESFKKRLATSTLNAGNFKQLKLTIAALIALDEYAFNKLFAAWDLGSDKPSEVDCFSPEIKALMPQKQPCDYLPYPLRGWGGQDIRKETWDTIYAVVPTKLKLK